MSKYFLFFRLVHIYDVFHGAMIVDTADPRNRSVAPKGSSSHIIQVVKDRKPILSAGTMFTTVGEDVAWAGP